MQTIIATSLALAFAMTSASQAAVLEGMNHNTQEAQQNMTENQRLIESIDIDYSTFSAAQNSACQNVQPSLNRIQDRLMDIAASTGRPRSDGFIDDKTRAVFVPIVIKSCYVGIVVTQRGGWADQNLSMRLKVENVEHQAIHPLDKANAVGMRAAYETFVTGHNVADK